MGRWKGFDKIVKPTLPPPGSGGDVSEEVLQVINNHIEDSIPHLDDGDLSKDIVFKLYSPIDIGIQNDTEFLYPDSGVITNIDASISLDSNPSSNIILSIQKYTNTWETISTLQLQVGQKEISSSPGLNSLINNNRLRISIIEGDVESIKNMTIVIKVTVPISNE